MIKVSATSLKDVLIIEPRLFKDSRGMFLETYHQKKYAEAGIDRSFVQDNLSFSVKGTLRGMHYQLKKPQAKLVQAIEGSIFDVVVDIRRGSPTFAQWVGIELTDGNCRQLYVPEGFAHGFCVMSDTAYVAYKCTDYYSPGDEGGILFSDPGIGIKWPVADPLLSDKDSCYPCLADVPEDRLPKWPYS